jgi:hypothetical protein
MPSNLYAEDNLRAHLIVQTIPPGAEVFVDEKSVGKSPVAVEVRLGSSYWIEITGAGSVAFESKVRIERQMQRMLVELGRKKPVKFSPDLPEGHRLFIDNVFIGECANLIWLQPSSRHILRIEKQHLPKMTHEIIIPVDSEKKLGSR